MRLTQSPAAPSGCWARRLWWTAQCSLSTGTSSPAPGCDRTRRTTGPAAISDSLLASASRLPDVERGQRDAEPGEPDDAVDAHVADRGDGGERVGPGDDLGARRARAPASSAASVSSAMATTAGRHRCACSASWSTDDPAPSAATENRSGSAAMTSSACVPIDPVDPAIDDSGGHRTRLPTDRPWPSGEHEGRLRRPLSAATPPSREGCSATPNPEPSAARRTRSRSSASGPKIRRRSP